MMVAPLPYYCIHCGHEEPQVYKTYAKGNLVKLLPCSSCGQLIDKYVEYDLVIVVINIILQNSMAYRHLLLNTAFQDFWKLGIVFLFSESYCYWCIQKGTQEEAPGSDFYAIELNFYRALFRGFMSTLIFHTSMLVIPLIKYKFTPRPSQFSALTLWKGLCLSGFSALFELVAIIWSFSQSSSKLVFVNGLLLLSTSKSYQVITGASLIESLLTSLSALALRYFIIIHFFDYWFPT